MYTINIKKAGNQTINNQHVYRHKGGQPITIINAIKR